MSKVRDLISAEIDRLKGVKQSVLAQIDQTRALLDTQKQTLGVLNQDIDDYKAAFKHLGGGDLP